MRRRRSPVTLPFLTATPPSFQRSQQAADEPDELQEDIGMMWGDAGRLYWWIRDADLRNGEWDDSWFVLQCC